MLETVGQASEGLSDFERAITAIGILPCAWHKDNPKTTCERAITNKHRELLSIAFPESKCFQKTEAMPKGSRRPKVQKGSRNPTVSKKRRNPTVPKGYLILLANALAKLRDKDKTTPIFGKKFTYQEWVALTHCGSLAVVLDLDADRREKYNDPWKDVQSPDIIKHLDVITKTDKSYRLVPLAGTIGDNTEPIPLPNQDPTVAQAEKGCESPPSPFDIHGWVGFPFDIETPGIPCSTTDSHPASPVEDSFSTSLPSERGVQRSPPQPQAPPLKQQPDKQVALRGNLEQIIEPAMAAPAHELSKQKHSRDNDDRSVDPISEIGGAVGKKSKAEATEEQIMSEVLSKISDVMKGWAEQFIENPTPSIHSLLKGVHENLYRLLEIASSLMQSESHQHEWILEALARPLEDPQIQHSSPWNELLHFGDKLVEEHRSNRHAPNRDRLRSAMQTFAERTFRPFILQEMYSDFHRNVHCKNLQTDLWLQTARQSPTQRSHPEHQDSENLFRCRLLGQDISWKSRDIWIKCLDEIATQPDTMSGEQIKTILKQIQSLRLTLVEKRYHRIDEASLALASVHASCRRLKSTMDTVEKMTSGATSYNIKEAFASIEEALYTTRSLQREAKELSAACLEPTLKDAAEREKVLQSHHPGKTYEFAPAGRLQQICRQQMGAIDDLRGQHPTFIEWSQLPKFSVWNQARPNPHHEVTSKQIEEELTDMIKNLIITPTARLGLTKRRERIDPARKIFDDVDEPWDATRRMIPNEKTVILHPSHRRVDDGKADPSIWTRGTWKRHFDANSSTDDHDYRGFDTIWKARPPPDGAAQ